MTEMVAIKGRWSPALYYADYWWVKKSHAERNAAPQDCGEAVSQAGNAVRRSVPVLPAATPLPTPAVAAPEPCGECTIGVYTESALLNRTARIFGAKSEQERLACMPRCKTFDRECQGALEFHRWLVAIDKHAEPQRG